MLPLEEGPLANAAELSFTDGFIQGCSDRATGCYSVDLCRTRVLFLRGDFNVKSPFDVRSMISTKVHDEDPF